MKIYIATGLSNHVAHNVLRDRLVERGHTITHDWTEHGGVWREGFKRIAEIAALEQTGVETADVVIVMPSTGQDRGTHTELGIALAHRKPIVILSGNPNHFDAHPDTVAFYHAVGVVWARTMDEAIAAAEATKLSPSAHVLNLLANIVHAANAKWWLDLETGLPIKRNIGELLMLVVSELSEAMEGHRKNLQDDKLPHRKMFEVELADAIIRIFDICGGMGLDLGGAFGEKMAYNSVRHDHTVEGRKAVGGKQY